MSFLLVPVVRGAQRGLPRLASLLPATFTDAAWPQVGAASYQPSFALGGMLEVWVVVYWSGALEGCKALHNPH